MALVQRPLVFLRHQLGLFMLSIAGEVDQTKPFERLLKIDLEAITVVILIKVILGCESMISEKQLTTGC